jgi:hypothetical protein
MQNGEGFIKRDRALTENRRVLMGGQRRCKKACLQCIERSHSRRNAYGRKLTLLIAFCKMIHHDGDS